MKTMKKRRIVLVALTLLLLLVLSSCGKNPLKHRYYTDEDAGLALYFSDYLYILTDDDVSISRYSYAGDQITIGGSVFECSLSEDAKVLTLDGERLEKKGVSFAANYRMARACSQLYIGEHGFLGWLLTPFYAWGSNSIGTMAIGSALVVDVGIFIAILFIGFIISKISGR